jgi:hypothetical protein
MPQTTTIISITAGIVTSVKKTNSGGWIITVTNKNGTSIYTDIDIPAVANCQEVTVGYVLGYKNNPNTVINIGKQMYKYRGNGTAVHTDIRLVGATDVFWSRTGMFKDDGLAADSFTHDDANGTITSTEVQQTYEWFHVMYTPKP